MRETRIIEFKETITNTFLKTVSAFSNYNGGEIYFGIDDNGNVKGIADVKQCCLESIQVKGIKEKWYCNDRGRYIRVFTSYIGG